MVRVQPLVLVVLVGSLSGGCGETAGSGPDAEDPPHDAGTADDAGPDAGTVPDAGPDAGTDPDAGPDAGIPGSALVTVAEGGLVVSEDGLARLFVTPGALTQDTTISITRVSDADVPADLAAANPVSAVYAVEPDGLTFGGDGAWAHFAFPTIPPQLVTGTPARYTGMTGLSRQNAGGEIERSAVSETYFDLGAGRADVVTRLAHLSFQMVSDQGVTVEADLGTDRHAVGERWSATNVTIAVTPTLVDSSGAASAELYRTTLFAHNGDAVTPSLADAVLGADVVPDAVLTALGLRQITAQEMELGTGAAGTTPRVFTPGSAATYVCTREGAGSASLGARAIWATLTDGTPIAAGGTVLVQPVDCIPAPVIRATVSETTTCRREGDAVDCGDASTPTAEVEVLSPQTTFVATPFGNFVVTTPEGSSPAEGPDTIVATTDNGSMMTATRDPDTGAYDEVFADPPSFFFDGDAMTFDADGDLFDVSLVDEDWVLGLGPVEGLDTDLQLVPGEFADTNAVIVDVRVRFIDPVDCAGVRVGMFVEGAFDATDAGNGSWELEAPLRGLFEDAAIHCNVPIEALEVIPTVTTFIVIRDELPAAFDETPGGLARYAVVSDVIEIDSSTLAATCPADQTYCTDACVDTATDPDNCGACGLAPVELCDTIDNNCDGDIDEGCPSTLLWGGASTLMGTFGGPSPGDSGASSSCAYPAFLAGVCGNVDDTTGNIRSLRARCATSTLVLPTEATPDDYEIRTTLSACAPSGGGSAGGTAFALDCPPHMFLDGFDGLEDPYIGSLRARCSSYDVQRAGDAWAIVRTGSAQTISAGTGPGTAFSWVLSDSTTSGFPGAVRGIEVRYEIAAVAAVTRAWVYGTWPSLGF